MEDRLYDILGTLGYPVRRQGSVAPDGDYPETFITFWQTDSADHAHYDNREYGTTWTFGIYVYSSDPALTYSVLDAARTALKADGWIISGRGFDVTSDEPTHTGRGLTITYLEF